MLFAIGMILLVAWLLGLVAFHVGGIIHFLLVLALVSVIVHFLTGGRTRTV